MVSTIWLSVSRRSETAGIPESWIFARDWLRLDKNAPTLILGLGGWGSSKSPYMYRSVRATLIPS